MGQRGPVKGSRHFGVVKGGKSNTSSKEAPKPSGKRPAIPKWLPPEGRKLLRKIIPDLEAMLAEQGGLKQADSVGLSALALHYAILAMAAEQLKDENGVTRLTVEDPEHPVLDGEDPDEGSKPAVRKHPLLSVIAGNSEKLKAWVSEFALTPAARERLNIKPPKGANKLDKFVSGKKY